MKFYVNFRAKLGFQIFNSAVIPSEGPTLEPSNFRAFLRKKIMVRQKVQKSKRRGLGRRILQSLKVAFYVNFREKLDFEIFNSVVIPSEGPNLEASRAFLRKNNYVKTKNFKNLKRRGFC